MPIIQFERLRKDIKNLEEYEHKLRKKGKNDLLKKVSQKKEYLKAHLQEALSA